MQTVEQRNNGGGYGEAVGGALAGGTVLGVAGGFLAVGWYEAFVADPDGWGALGAAVYGATTGGALAGSVLGTWLLLRVRGQRHAAATSGLAGLLVALLAVGIGYLAGLSWGAVTALVVGPLLARAVVLAATRAQR